MGAWASTYDRSRASSAAATVVQLRRRGKGCLSYVIGAGSELRRHRPVARTGAVPGGGGHRITGQSPTCWTPIYTPIT